MIFQQPEKKRHHSEFNSDDEERETKRQKTERETDSQNIGKVESEKKKECGTELEIGTEVEIGAESDTEGEAEVQIIFETAIDRVAEYTGEEPVTEDQLSAFKALLMALFHRKNVTQIYWDVVRANAKAKLNFREDLVMACMERMPFGFVMLRNQILYLLMDINSPN
jgi:hypothetical protein